MSKSNPSVTVVLNPSSIVADGKATSQATATVKDGTGNPVMSDTVSFSTDGDVTFGPVANNQDGSITQIDPKSHRVLQTIATGGTPTSLAFAAGSLWATPVWRAC